MEHQSEVIDKFTEETQDRFPEMPRQIGKYTTLQRGLFNKITNTWEKNAEVRELTGYDEEHIASLDNKVSLTYADYITEILKLGVVSIGNIPNVADHVEDLTIGDRNALFLAVVQTTYGRERSFDRACISCSKINKITIDLVDDFPIVEPSFDPTSTLKITLKDGSIHQLRPPTAADTTYVGNNANTNAEQSTMLLARCSVWDENPPRDPFTWARSLGMADRNTLIKELISIEMGPHMEGVDVECVHCGERLPALIDWVFLILG